MGGRAGSGGDDGASGNGRVDVAHACHEINDAMSALILNVEFLADKTMADRQAVEDARPSIDRVVELARAIQGAAGSNPPGPPPPSASPSGHAPED